MRGKAGAIWATALFGALLPIIAVTGLTTTAEPADAAAILPPGFRDTTVLTGLDTPTAVRFSPDGRVFVAEKSGLIRVFDSLSDTSPTTFADLRTQVHNYWDRGLLGMTLDPDFPTNPYVYVLYTHDAAIGGTAPRWGVAGQTSDDCPTPPGPTETGCKVSGRLSRLQANGDHMTGAEDVLIEGWCQQFSSHSIGDLEFGPDGALYVSGGDGADFNRVDFGQYGNPPNPCGDPANEGGALRSQDLRTNGDKAGLNGTVLRVDPATGLGLPGNPMYSSTDKNARRIVAYGMRNPFRIAFEPGTNNLWVGEVGWDSFEELDRIADPTAGAADNFGWPCYEGNGHQVGYAPVHLPICETMYQTDPVARPVYKYAHYQPFVDGESCPTGSSSLSGVEFYEGGDYPASYDGAMFVADYSRSCIWAIPEGGEPITLVDGASAPVDLEIGPGGDLFYVDIALGAIHRITWEEPGSVTDSAYVSDLDWVGESNGFGPVERDQSNGEDAAGDGSTITIGGVTHSKGIGSHAESDIAVELGATCTRFQATVGVDDEVGSNGSVAFEVRGDGQTLYQSPVRTGSQGGLPIDVDISGVSQLRLVVSDGGNGVSSDHADWGSARVVCSDDPTTVALGNRDWLTATNGFGPVERNSSNGESAAGDGQQQHLNGVAYDNGLGVHANSSITYATGGACSRFEASLGIDDEIATGGSVRFAVYTDGHRRYRSSVVTSSSPTRDISIDISGSHQLELVVSGTTDGIGSDHADWADARLTCGGDGGGGSGGVAHIDTPTGGSRWPVGQTLTYRGGAEDAQGHTLPASALTWTLRLRHCPSSCHVHEMQTFLATRSGSFVAPDHEYPSYLELQLTAALPGGGTATDTVELEPRTVPLTLASNPSGVPGVVMGTASGGAPLTRTVISGSSNTVTAPDTATIGGHAYEFWNWSDGGARSHAVTAGTSATTVTARYRLAPSEDFAAYDDLNPATGDHNAARVNRFTYRSANGSLVDRTSSGATGITVTGSRTGGLDPRTGPLNAQAAPGTDAGTAFGPPGGTIVDLGRAIELDATNWKNTVTLSGLDPNRRYTITMTANRGDVGLANARFTKVTLTGAPSSTNASSAGVVVLSPTAVSFSTGYNTTNGYVARWTDVAPGADGRIALTSAWDATHGSGPRNTGAYAMSALLVQPT